MGLSQRLDLLNEVGAFRFSGLKLGELIGREVSVVIDAAQALALARELDGQGICRCIVADSGDLRRFNCVHGDNRVLNSFSVHAASFLGWLTAACRCLAMAAHMAGKSLSKYNFADLSVAACANPSWARPSTVIDSGASRSLIWPSFSVGLADFLVGVGQVASATVGWVAAKSCPPLDSLSVCAVGESSVPSDCLAAASSAAAFWSSTIFCAALSIFSCSTRLCSLMRVVITSRKSSMGLTASCCRSGKSARYSATFSFTHFSFARSSDASVSAADLP